MLLGAVAAAFLLVPVAQAAAAEVHIDIVGTGSGEVSSVGETSEGTPPIECTGPPTTGICDTDMDEEEGVGSISLNAIPDPGSEIAGWSLSGSGVPFQGCSSGTSCNIFDFSGGTGSTTVTVTFNTAGPEEFPLTVTTNTGTGTGTVQCDTGTGPEACAAEYEEGTEVTLTQSADPGSEFVEWTGDCTGSGVCEVTMDEARTVNAVFGEIPPTPEFALNLTTSGSGSGSFECDTGAGAEACQAEYEEGTEVTVIPVANSGSEFVEFNAENGGECSGATCEVTMDEARTVNAVFDEEAIENPATLSLINGGYAEGGSVSSSPEGIDCGTACTVDTAEFEEGETVTLTAVAEPGFVFAGWLGCKFVSVSPSEGVCEVTVEGPMTEVTAVFVKDGEPGEDGEDGEGVTVTPEPPGANCPNGGVKVESSLGTEYVCNGEDGEKGDPGDTGLQGPAGQDGEDGQDGSDGSNGRNGSNGVPGVPGVPGVQGPRGPAGPQGRIVCKARQKGKRIIVRCRVRPNNRAGKRANRRQQVRWAVMQGGKAQVHGTTSVRRLQRVVNRRLPEGRYVLRVRGQKGMRIAVR